MTRHGSWNTTTTHPGISEEPAAVKHCGRCRNPFINNPDCECGCHGKKATSCSHPPEALTWEHKWAGKVAVIDGHIHAICDLCGERVFIPVGGTNEQ